MQKYLCCILLHFFSKRCFAVISICLCFSRNSKCSQLQKSVFHFTSKLWTVFRLLCSVWFSVLILIFILTSTCRNTPNRLILCSYMQQHQFSILKQYLNQQQKNSLWCKTFYNENIPLTKRDFIKDAKWKERRKPNHKKNLYFFGR